MESGSKYTFYTARHCCCYSRFSGTSSLPLVPCPAQVSPFETSLLCKKGENVLSFKLLVFSASFFGTFVSPLSSRPRHALSFLGEGSLKRILDGNMKKNQEKSFLLHVFTFFITEDSVVSLKKKLSF